MGGRGEIGGGGASFSLIGPGYSRQRSFDERCVRPRTGSGSLPQFRRSADARSNGFAAPTYQSGLDLGTRLVRTIPSEITQGRETLITIHIIKRYATIVCKTEIKRVNLDTETWYFDACKRSQKR